MKAIETVYDGHHFRSRQEARFAVFFHALGIPYEYEKEGYELEGHRYLPDFWLPQQQCWLEIKGQDPTEEEVHKAKLLVKHSHHPLFIASGPFPEYQADEQPLSSEELAEWWELHEHDDFSNITNLDAVLWMPWGPDRTWEAWQHGGGLTWCECPTCHRLCIRWFTMESRHDYFCQCPTLPIDNSPRIVSAYAAGRMARFEHGKHGN